MDVESVSRATHATPAPRPPTPAGAPHRRAPVAPPQGSRAPGPDASAPGELRLRVPRIYVVQDVKLPLVYH